MPDITILKKVQSMGGQNGRLYYFEGNFYHPLFMRNKERKRVEKAIRLFKIKNKDLIIQDRQKRTYKDPMALEDLFFATPPQAQTD